MSTRDVTAAAEYYGTIMTEVSGRIGVLQAICRGDLTLPPFAQRDLGFVELRLICELIALACVVAHGDLEETSTKRFNDEYRADQLINRLEKLHPLFFPLAGKQTVDDSGHHFEALKLPHLTKAQLLDSYRDSGNRLHRGTLRRLRPTLTATVEELASIIEFTELVTALLTVHVIAMRGGKRIVICLMSAGESGAVQVSLGEALDEQAV